MLDILTISSHFFLLTLHLIFEDEGYIFMYHRIYTFFKTKLNSFHLYLFIYLFIYLGFYVAFNTVQVISRRVVGRAEETST